MRGIIQVVRMECQGVCDAWGQGVIHRGGGISGGPYSMLCYSQLGDATYKMFLVKENLQKLFEPFHCHVSLSK